MIDVDIHIQLFTFDFLINTTVFKIYEAEI